MKTWQVRWDGTGGHFAVWVADKGSSKVGRLTLFGVNGDDDQLGTEKLLGAERVMASIQFDASHLVYTSAVDGKTYLQAIPAGKPQMPTPSASANPGELGASPTPLSTDRPGN